MRITCKCGNVFITKSIECPDGKVGCAVYHPDPTSYVCGSCGQDTLPEIRRCYQEGKVSYENGITVLNTDSIKKLELNHG